jgi:hypothetical protein
MHTEKRFRLENFDTYNIVWEIILEERDLIHHCFADYFIKREIYFVNCGTMLMLNFLFLHGKSTIS